MVPENAETKDELQSTHDRVGTMLASRYACNAETLKMILESSYTVFTFENDGRFYNVSCYYSSEAFAKEMSQQQLPVFESRMLFYVF